MIRPFSPLAAALLLTVGALADDKPKHDLRGHRDAVTQVVFSPDGKRLASIGVGEEKLFLWDLQTGKYTRIGPSERLLNAGAGPARLTNEVRRMEAIAFHPDGKRIAEASDERAAGSYLRLWNIDSPGQPQVLASGQRNIRAVTFSPDGKLLAYTQGVKGSPNNAIILRDFEGGQTIGELRDDRLAATSICFSPDGHWLASVGARNLHIWDVNARKLKHSVAANSKSIQAVAFSPDSETVATGGTDDLIRVWNVNDGAKKLEITADQDGVMALAFSQSGRSIISGGANNQVRVFSSVSGRRRDTLWGHVDKVTTVAVSADGTQIATGAKDRNILVWNFNEPVGEPKEEKPDKDKDKKKPERP